MQIALYGSIGWRHPLGLQRVFQWAKEFGWDAVDARGMSIDIEGPLDVRINAFGYDMLGPRQIRPSARRELRTMLEDAGLKLLGIYCSSPVNLSGERGDAARELCKEYLQLGADLGVEWIRPINNVAENPADLHDQKTAYQRTVEGLIEIGERANELGVGLLLENNENTVTPDAASLLGLKDELQRVCRMGIAYDGANAYFQGLDPSHEIQRLAGQIDVMHLKNVKRHTEQQWDYMPRGEFSYEWTGLADGDLDWPDLVGQAVANGFAGPLVYEYVNPFKGMKPSYWDILPEPEAAAEREGQYLRNLIEDVSPK